MLKLIAKSVFLPLLLHFGNSIAVLNSGHLPDPDLSFSAGNYNDNEHTDSPYNLPHDINPIVQQQQQLQQQQYGVSYSYQSSTGPIAQQESSNFGFSPLNQNPEQTPTLYPNTLQYNHGESNAEKSQKNDATYYVPSGNNAYDGPKSAVHSNSPSDESQSFYMPNSGSTYEFTAAAAGFNGYDQHAGTTVGANQNYITTQSIDRFYTHGQLTNQNYASPPVHTAHIPTDDAVTTTPPIGSAASLFFKPIAALVDASSHASDFSTHSNIAIFQPTPPPAKSSYRAKNNIRTAPPSYAKGEKGLGHYTYAVSKPIALKAATPETTAYLSTAKDNGEKANLISGALYHQQSDDSNPAGYFTTVSNQGHFRIRDFFEGSQLRSYRDPVQTVTKVVYGRPHDVESINGQSTAWVPGRI